jgi:hypothetical protein|tara:strand:+ start:124 stop:489 length:366 start_codon:yes stop_codon:yes gene_type:complete
VAVTRSQAKALEKQMAEAEAMAAAAAAAAAPEARTEELFCDESPISSPGHVYEPIELFPIASIEHGKEQVCIIEQPVVTNENAKSGGLVLVGVFGVVGIRVAWKYSDQLTKSIRSWLKKWF